MGLSQEKRAILDAKFGVAAKKPSVTADVVKSGASGLAKGVLLDTAMVLPNLLNEAVAGPQYLYEGVFGEDRKDFKPWQPFFSSSDVAKEIPGLNYQPKTAEGRATQFGTQLVGNVVGPTAFSKAANSKIATDQRSGGRPEKVSAKDLENISKASYESARKVGGEMDASSVDRYIDSVGKMQFKSAKAAEIAGEGEAKRVAELIKGWKGQRLSFDEIDEIDKAITEKITEAFVGGKSADATKIGRMQSEFRNAVSNVQGGAELKRARDLWAAKSRLGDIENIVKRAELMQNPSSALQTGFRQLAMDDMRMAGFTGRERKLIESAAKEGVTAETLRILGSRLIPIGNAITGSNALVGLTGSKAARTGSSALQMRQADKVAESIVNRTKGLMQEAPSIRQQVANSKSARMASYGVKRATAISPIGAMSAEQPQQTRLPEEKRKLIEAAIAKRASVQMEPMSYQSTGGDYFQKLAQAESGGNPNARAKTSSASGLYQFTDGTWMNMVNKHGKELGITMKDKNNPEAQHLMVQKLTEQNANILSSKLGIEPTEGHLYAAHFLGASDAAKLIQAQGTGQNAAQLFPRAAKANKSIFYKGLKPRTVEEVYAILEQKVS